MDEHRAYINKQEALKKEAAAKIRVLRTRARRADGATRNIFREQIETLTRREREFGEKIGQLRRSGTGTWQDLQKAVDDTWMDLTGQIHETFNRLL